LLLIHTTLSIFVLRDRVNGIIYCAEVVQNCFACFQVLCLSHFDTDIDSGVHKEVAICWLKIDVIPCALLTVEASSFRKG